MGFVHIGNDRAARWLRGMLAGLAAFVMCLAGCSGEEHVPTHPVHGRLTFEGEPTPGAFVVFHPLGAPLEVAGEVDVEAPNRPTALVNPDGTFELTTYEAKDGAPAGDYAVTVQWNKLIVSGRDATPGPNVIPATYANPGTTPWKVTINAGDNDLPQHQITQ